MSYQLDTGHENLLLLMAISVSLPVVKAHVQCRMPSTLDCLRGAYPLEDPHVLRP
jgi:hypothetical protein